MTIKHIKIYGERNSGTTYISGLMLNNYRIVWKDPTGIDIHDGNALDGDGWKHGKPLDFLFNKKETLFIVIIRNLEDWLLSMYHNSYHIRPISEYGKGDFNNFITKKGFSLQYNMMEYFPIKHKFKKIHLNAVRFERNKNMFDLRYTKFEEYKKLIVSSNIAFINLKYFQANPRVVFDHLDKEYGLSQYRLPNFYNIEKHVKSGKKEKSRKYDKNIIDTNFIKKHSNKEIENFVDSLTVKCYKRITTS